MNSFVREIEAEFIDDRKNSSDYGFFVFSYDMYLVNDYNLKQYDRLLHVDKPLYLPTESSILFLVSSVDVLHCFAIPYLGIKIDACPGRINEVHIKVDLAGIYSGQCSEICGINHGFMPIQIYFKNFFFNFMEKIYFNLTKQNSKVNMPLVE
jgi:heme/copper-type cytochrome/quinol oxidase subunit 2